MTDLVKCLKCNQVYFSTEVNCPNCGEKNEQVEDMVQEDILKKIGGATNFTEKMDAIRKEQTSKNKYGVENPYHLSDSK